MAHETSDTALRVLILDDETQWLELLSEIVKAIGFTPIPVNSLDDARRALIDGNVDIAIVDLFLTRKLKKVPRGMQLIEDISTSHYDNKRRPVVVVISGSDEFSADIAQQLSTYQNRGVVKAIMSKGITFRDQNVEQVLKEIADNFTQTQIENEGRDLPTYRLEEQSWYVPRLPDSREIKHDELSTLKGEIDVLIVTATDVELFAAMHHMKPFSYHKDILRTFIDQETYYLGKFGEFETVITKFRMGLTGEGSSILAIEKAIREWCPRAVIMVGVAFGKSWQNQTIADVLVATHIIAYEPQHVRNEIQYDGAITPCNSTLLNRFENAHNWRFNLPDGKACKVHFGPMLSGEKLVDNPALKAQLFEHYRQAIGGEMEGAGLAAVAGRLGVAWIMVKSICDWADGHKVNKYQPLAAATSTSFVNYVLSQSTVLDGIQKRK